MILVKRKIVAAMALTCFISFLVEVAATVLMLKYDSVETALKINAALTFNEVFTLAAITVFGLIGLAGKLSAPRMFLIITGVFFIFLGLSQ